MKTSLLGCWYGDLGNRAVRIAPLLLSTCQLRLPCVGQEYLGVELEEEELEKLFKKYDLVRRSP
jgi:hypothetical protein